MEQDPFAMRQSSHFFQKQNKPKFELRKSGSREENNFWTDLGPARRFVFRNRVAKPAGTEARDTPLLYNVHMSETKAVRLTETVKAAG